jgi:hypothetical protein
MWEIPSSFLVALPPALPPLRKAATSCNWVAVSLAVVQVVELPPAALVEISKLDIVAFQK